MDGNELKGYLVRYKYTDGSDDKGIRLYANRDTAVKLLSILQEFGDDSKIYYIEDYPKHKGNE